MMSVRGSSARAALLMTAASLLLSLVPLFVKLIPPESGIPLEEKILARAAVSLAVTWVMVARRRTGLKPVRPRLILLRCLTGTAGMFLYFHAVAGLDLADAVTLNRLSPFFVLIFAFVFLGERLLRLQAAAIVLAFAGAVLVLQPGRLPLTLPGIMALLSAVAAGGAYTTLRALADHDSPIRIVFWFSAFMTVLFLPPTLLKGSIPCPRDGLLLAGIGLAGAGGQLLMTTAYRHAPGGEVAVYGYLSVVYAALWQPLFFGRAPAPAVLAGGAMVLCGGLLNYAVGRKRPDRLSDASSREAEDQPQPPP
jgi:drug/metabolite transporter (DMT)-like permease